MTNLRREMIPTIGGQLEPASLKLSSKHHFTVASSAVVTTTFVSGHPGE